MKYFKCTEVLGLENTTRATTVYAAASDMEGLPLSEKRARLGCQSRGWAGRQGRIPREPSRASIILSCEHSPAASDGGLVQPTPGNIPFPRGSLAQADCGGGSCSSLALSPPWRRPP